MPNAKPAQKAQAKPAKGHWALSKMEITFPRTLADDFRSECDARKLSYHGVVRDLMICWLAANKEGLNIDSYVAKLQQDLNDAKMAEKRAKAARNAKTTSIEKIAAQAAKRAASKPVPEPDASMQMPNPYEGLDLD